MKTTSNQKINQRYNFCNSSYYNNYANTFEKLSRSTITSAINLSNQALPAAPAYSAIYYSSILPLPPFLIRKKIDYLIFSELHVSRLLSIFNILKRNKFSRIEDTMLNKTKTLYSQQFDKIDFFKRVDYASVIEVHHSETHRWKPFKLKIHDPDINILKFFYAVFNYLSLNYKHSQTELTIDHFTDDVPKLKEFIKAFLFLKYQGSPAIIFEDTYYPNNLRRSKTKAMRSYAKDIIVKPCDNSDIDNDEEEEASLNISFKEVDSGSYNTETRKVVRLELLLKRRFLRKLEPDFSFFDVDSINLQNFFYFRAIKDLELIHSLTKTQMRLKNKKIKKGGKSMRDLYTPISMFISRIHSLMLENPSLMQRIEKLLMDG